MKYLTDKDLSLNAKNDEINALELSKYCSDDMETIKDTMLELRIMKYVKYDPKLTYEIMQDMSFEEMPKRKVK